MKHIAQDVFDPNDVSTIAALPDDLPPIFQGFAQAVARSVGQIVPDTTNEQKICEYLSKLITVYNAQYGGSISALLADDGYTSDLAIGGEDHADAYRWKAGMTERKRLGESAQLAKNALKVLFHQIPSFKTNDDKVEAIEYCGFSPEIPNQLLLNALHVEFDSRVSKVTAFDVYATEGSEPFDKRMGVHMLDDDTDTEFDHSQTRGMSELAYEIMQVANYLRVVRRNAPRPVFV